MALRGFEGTFYLQQAKGSRGALAFVLMSLGFCLVFRLLPVFAILGSLL